MLIYDALKKDHEKVKGLLNQLIALDEDDDDTRESLVMQLRDDLIPHARAEESVFYNSLRTFESAKDVGLHGYKEHMEAESLLRMLQIQDKMDMGWKDTARKLKEALEHHIQEEEGKMFSLARSLFSDEEAEMMGKSFESLKPEIKEENIVETTWDMVANLMPPRFKNRFKDLNKHPQH
jgi:hemerythrin-like domain-containing protein